MPYLTVACGSTLLSYVVKNGADFSVNTNEQRLSAAVREQALSVLL
jgi:hypothetical protein